MTNCGLDFTKMTKDIISLFPLVKKKVETHIDRGTRCYQEVLVYCVCVCVCVCPRKAKKDKDRDREKKEAEREKE